MPLRSWEGAYSSGVEADGQGVCVFLSAVEPTDVVVLISGARGNSARRSGDLQLFTASSIPDASSAQFVPTLTRGPSRDQTTRMVDVRRTRWWTRRDAKY